MDDGISHIIDIRHIAKELKRYYPIDGIIGISKVGVLDPAAPEHEHEMDCLWIGLHRKNKIKLPKMFRGFRIFTKLMGRVKMAI